MSTKDDLVASSKAVNDAAAQLAQVAQALQTYVNSLPKGQNVDQPTLDAVVAELQGASSGITNAASVLQGLIPPA